MPKASIKLRVAIDLGNSQVKIYIPEQESNKKDIFIVNPSSLLPASAVADSVINLTTSDKSANALKTHDFQLTNDPISYKWGKSLTQFHQDDEIRQSISKTNRYSMVEYQLLANFAMALAVKEAGLEDEEVSVSVAVGLPDSDYEALQKDKYKDIKSIYSGAHSVAIDGNTVHFSVDDEIRIIQQGIGTAVSMMLDDEGYLKDDSILSERVVVADVGGGTTIITTLDDFKPNLKLSKTIWTGSNSIYRDIIKNVLENQGVDMNINKLEENIKDKNFTYKAGRNKIIDFKDEYTNAINAAISRLKNNMQTIVADMDGVDRLIFTGGGVNLFNLDDLTHMFGFGEKASNSEFANVIGFARAQLLD